MMKKNTNLRLQLNDLYVDFEPCIPPSFKVELPSQLIEHTSSHWQIQLGYWVVKLFYKKVLPEYLLIDKFIRTSRSSMHGGVK